ncbi:restriction endonuclease [Halobacillus andaensis]|uniref:restriction endonuclease n=1 Tax=Halobacillus andaensis TaxID=1176239 RepID=UPI003D7187C1
MVFRYYFKQCKKLHKFEHWAFKDKIKFIGITNLIFVAIASLFPSSELLTLTFTFFFLFSVFYTIYHLIKLTILKVTKYFPHQYFNTKKELLIKEVDKMDGVQFEELLFHLFQQQGFLVKITPKSNDFGADLILRKGNDLIVVQAKRYSENIGISAINEVVGAAGYYNANKKWVVTNRYFTNAAAIQAYKNKVKLFDRDNLLLMLKEYNTPRPPKGLLKKK